MATRQHFSSFQTAEQTTTSATFQTATGTSLTFTPDANSDYFIFWCGELRNSTNTTADVSARLFDVTAAASLDDAVLRVKDVLDYWSVGGFARKQYGASPGSQTIRLEWSSNGGSATAAFRSGRIVIIKAAPGDQYAESLGSSANSTTTFADKATLTFTPASQGDYLMIAMGRANSSASYQMWRLDQDSGTLLTEHRKYNGGSTDWQTCIHVRRIDALTAASHTFKTQFRSGAAGTSVNTRQNRLLMLRLDSQWGPYNYGSAMSRTTTTSTTFGEKLTVTRNPPAATDQIGFMCCTFDVNSTSQQSEARAQESDTVNFVIPKVEGRHATDLNECPFFVCSSRNFSGARNYDIDFRTLNAAATAGCKDAAIIVLDTEYSTAVNNPKSVTGTAPSTATLGAVKNVGSIPQFVGQTEATGTSPLTINKPAGVANGDLLIAAMFMQGPDSETMSAPAGWTQVLQSTIDATSAVASRYSKVGIWRRVVSGDGASYDWTMSGSAQAALMMCAYRNISASAPLENESITDRILGSVENVWGNVTPGA